MKARTWGAWTWVALVFIACGDVDPLEPMAPPPFSHEGTTDRIPEPLTTSGVTLEAGDPARRTNGSDGDTGMDGTTGDLPDPTGPQGTSGAPQPCPEGSEGCSCAAGNTCDPGLVCWSMICVDAGPECPIGSEGCPCTLNGGCDAGLVCLSNLCVDPNG